MQLALFQGRKAQSLDPAFSGLKRSMLDAGAWVDYVPQWLSGHEDLFEQLQREVTWRRTTQQLYDRFVETPRRVASFPKDGTSPPVLADIASALSARYGVRFDRVSAALYRDGQDSVAWHRDREYRDRPRAVVAIVSLGAPRRFLLRPYRRPADGTRRPADGTRRPADGTRRPDSARLGDEAKDAETIDRSTLTGRIGGDGRSVGRTRRSIAYRLGWGDLLVMGGESQRTWEHAVPKVPHADPRVSIMFRHDPDESAFDEASLRRQSQPLARAMRAASMRLRAPTF